MSLDTVLLSAENVQAKKTKAKIIPQNRKKRKTMS